MNDKLDELAGDVDEALTTADELEDKPGSVKQSAIDHIKSNLEKAREGVDELENEDS